VRIQAHPYLTRSCVHVFMHFVTENLILII